jgi:hypothetical protein
LQDRSSYQGSFSQEVLEKLALFADTAVRQFIYKKLEAANIFFDNQSYEKILDVDVIVKIDDVDDSGFNLDIQVVLTLPPFINLNEAVLAEEAADYALEEIGKKFDELQRVNTPDNQ